MRPSLPPLRALCALALLLLNACGGGESPYTLTAVLPSPVTPGETAVVYGTLPQDTTLSLDETLVLGTLVPGGLEFTVPEAAIAGSQVLSARIGGQTLSGALQVVPRLDTATLAGNTLTVHGAGWPLETSAETPVTLEVVGKALTPTLSAGQLQATLPDLTRYGSLSVRVKVNDQVSNALNVVREAGAVQGKVVFPAESDAARIPASLEVQATDTSNFSALLVFADEAELEDLELEGLEHIESLPALGVTRLSFATRAQARAAYLSLKAAGFGLEYDLPIRTDGFASLQADVPDEPGTGQWHLPLLGLEPAWEATKGGGVVVAVVDTGVQLDHPDLVANLLPGYDFVDGNDQPYDLAGHGTHVAGLVAANGQVLGTAPEAKLLPIRSLEGTAGGSAFTVAQGILWAAGLGEMENPNPADVINLSLGTSGYSATLAGAVTAAQATGVVVVAATGNSSGPLAYPAALPGVLSVTALAGPDIAYQPWYANKGTGVWVTGYGGDTTQDQDRDGFDDGILSADLGGYARRMGTSMAAPQVAGLAALALASGTPAELVRDTLGHTATDLGVMGYDASFGYGLATGRTAGPSTPRSYVLALAENEVVGWSLVQADGSYRLDNLPVDRSLALVAASDEDGDTVLGESGELLSVPVPFTPTPGDVLEARDLTLTLSEGSTSYSLEATP